MERAQNIFDVSAQVRAKVASKSSFMLDEVIKFREMLKNRR